LVATASESATVVWYDAATDGALLHTGDILSLSPLYSNSARYYAQAMYADNCRSVRTQAEYTVNNCAMSGSCPDYTAGNVAAPTALAACAAHYAGQIGGAIVSQSCLAHDAGRIGKQTSIPVISTGASIASEVEKSTDIRNALDKCGTGTTDVSTSLDMTKQRN
jgi:hypothetical protein